MKRAVLVAALLPTFAAAAFAQELPSAEAPAAADAAAPQADGPIIPVFPLRPSDRASVPGRGGADPWGGLVITISPIEEAADTPAAPAPAEGGQIIAQPLAPPDENIVIDPFAPAPDHMDMPSLWTTLDLALGDETIEVPPARPAARVATQPVRAATPQPVPTTFELKEGPAQFSVLTSVSNSQPVSSALSTEAGGGSGEVKGRVGYSLDNLSVYGVGGVGASESTGTVSVYDNAVLGTAYSVPLTSFGFGQGDKVGAKVEVDRSATTATSVELRSADGKVERYISIERSAPADSAASGVVRAGVTGKF